jgi:hypothetical protein
MDWLIEQVFRLRGHESVLWWLGSLSLATIMVSALAVPMLVRRMPHDYFLEHSAGSEWMRRQHPVLRWLLLVLKNLLGGVLVLGGFLMFFTPGQGVLTLVVGLLLMNFPGKRRFEIWLIRFGPVHRAIDWMRRRAGRCPIELPEG